jgi:hypothetical protein
VGVFPDGVAPWPPGPPAPGSSGGPPDPRPRWKNTPRGSRPVSPRRRPPIVAGCAIGATGSSTGLRCRPGPTGSAVSRPPPVSVGRRCRPAAGAPLGSPGRRCRPLTGTAPGPLGSPGRRCRPLTGTAPGPLGSLGRRCRPLAGWPPVGVPVESAGRRRRSPAAVSLAAVPLESPGRRSRPPPGEPPVELSGPPAGRRWLRGGRRSPASVSAVGLSRAGEPVSASSDPRRRRPAQPRRGGGVGAPVAPGRPPATGRSVAGRSPDPGVPRPS